MPKFIKGQIANPKGRPIGSKDKKWSSLQYWFSMLETELARQIHVKEYFANGKMYREYDQPAVEPNTRARLFLDGMKMIVSKMSSMPKDSEESTSNANKLMEDLKALEDVTLNEFKRRADKPSLEDRQTPL